jgi:hypothetical protein
MASYNDGKIFEFGAAIHEVGYPVPGRKDIHEDEVLGRFLWIAVPRNIRPKIIYGQTKFHTDAGWVQTKGGTDAGWCRFYGEDTIVDITDERLHWAWPGTQKHVSPPPEQKGNWFAGMTFKHWSADRPRDARIYVEY